MLGFTSLCCEWGREEPIERGRRRDHPHGVNSLRMRVRFEETGLVGEDDRLDAVAQAELLEDVRDVRLHRRVADEELLADLGVRKAVRDQAKDLLLARRQLV